jgi:hypothetical protein
VLFLTVLLSCAELLYQPLSWAGPPLSIGGMPMGMPMLFMGPEGGSMRETLDKMRDPTENLHINAWVTSGMNVKMHRPRMGSIMSQRNELSLQVAYTLSENVKLYTWLRPFWDSIYEWKGGSLTGRNGQTNRKHWGNNFDLSNNRRNDPLIREAYVDLRYGDFWARLGRQIVSWGKSDGVYLLDNIHPFNFRETVLLIEEEVKIPQWMINLNYRFGTVGTVQVLWIPQPEFADYPGRDPRAGNTQKSPNCKHDFVFNSVCLTNQLLATFDQFFKDNGIIGANGQPGFPYPNLHKPPGTLGSGEAMVRFDSEYRGLTYSLAYEYKYSWFLQDLSDAGKHHGVFGIGTAILGIGNVRKAKRIHIIGAAADYQWAWLPLFGEKVVTRMETAVFVDDIFFRPNFDTLHKNHYQILLGFDKFLLDPSWLNFPKLGLGPGAGVSWFFSMQVFQDWILNPERWNNAYVTGGSNNFSFETGRITNGLRGAFTTNVTVFLGKDILPDQSLSVATFTLIDTGFGDVFWNNQAVYRWSDYLVFTLGYNKFWGALTHPLGSNRLVDYIYAKVTLGL